MEGAWQVILVVVAIGVVAAVAWFAWQAEKKRRAELAALAARLDLSFDPGRDTHHDEKYADFGIFRRGHSRAAYNTLEGPVEISGRRCPLKMGDFLYKITTHTGKTTQTHTYRFSYLIVHTPFARQPDLVIRPEGILDKFAGALGFDDIDFESAEFSRRFLVKSPDKRFAYDVIHPQMMEFLLKTRPPAVHIVLGRCCLSDGHNCWEPAEFQGRLDWLRQFFELWPRHLV